MNYSGRLASASVFFLLLGSVFTAIAQASTIDQAEQGLEDAFLAVRSAEQAGANITHLTARLEEVGLLLGDARYELYIRNDSLSAGLLISQSLTLSGEIRDEAVSLENSAKSESADRLFLTAVTSSYSLCLLLVFGGLGYHYLGRWYVKRLRRMTPKVVD